VIAHWLCRSGEAQTAAAVSTVANAPVSTRDIYTDLAEEEGEDCGVGESVRRSWTAVEGQADEAHSDEAAVDGIVACAVSSRGLELAVIMEVVTCLKEGRSGRASTVVLMNIGTCRMGNIRVWIVETETETRTCCFMPKDQL